jgi:uncharacterized protein
VVTGASDGIGRAFAETLAAAGIHLVLVALREHVLTELANQFTQNHGIECRVLACDLKDSMGLGAVCSSTQSLDVGLLIATAGFGTSGRFVEAVLETELDMIDVNCRAVAHLSHHFGARFVLRRRGGLVLLSSIVGFQGVPGAANYAATKAYVQSLAEGLCAELTPFGVDVLSCAPGPVRSGFAERAAMTMGASVSPAVVARASLESLARSGTLRPGFLSKLLGWSLALVPRWGRIRLMASIMAGMTKRRG